jgi:dTDP-4-dehydrorhamnose reductase
MPEAARRPIRSTLNIEKAKSELGYAPRSLDVVLPLLF